MKVMKKTNSIEGVKVIKEVVCAVVTSTHKVNDPKNHLKYGKWPKM